MAFRFFLQKILSKIKNIFYFLKLNYQDSIKL